MMNKIKMLFFSVMAQLMSAVITPNPNVWIFSSTQNVHFDYNSRYLFEYLLNKHSEKQIYFVINDSNLRANLTSKYGPHFINTQSISGIITALRGGVWITSAGLPIYLLFGSSRRILVNLWHGVPLKKIVLKENNLNSIRRVFTKLVFSRKYTWVVTTSSKLIRIYADSFGVDASKIKVLGQPRNDVLFQYKQRTLASAFNGEQFDSMTKILYAPTYRDWKETILFPFSDFDLGRLEAFLTKNNAVIFIRFHLQNQNDTQIKETEHIRFINEDKFEDVMTVLNQFDMLITDYSSIYIDYLLLNKPIIFLPYDISEYQSKRGFNFDYNAVTPGYHVSDSMVNLMQIIKKYIANPRTHQNDRIKVNQYFNEITDHSSELIVRNLENKLQSMQE